MPRSVVGAGVGDLVRSGTSDFGMRMMEQVFYGVIIDFQQVAMIGVRKNVIRSQKGKLKWVNGRRRHFQLSFVEFVVILCGLCLS